MPHALATKIRQAKSVPPTTLHLTRAHILTLPPFGLYSRYSPTDQDQRVRDVDNPTRDTRAVVCRRTAGILAVTTGHFREGIDTLTTLGPPSQ
jgi:hypothetical protein